MFQCGACFKCNFQESHFSWFRARVYHLFRTGWFFCNSFTVLEVLFCREIKLLELNVIYLVLVSTNPDFIFSYANSFSVEAFAFVHSPYNKENFTLG